MVQLIISSPTLGALSKVVPLTLDKLRLLCHKRRHHASDLVNKHTTLVSAHGYRPEGTCGCLLIGSGLRMRSSSARPMTFSDTLRSFAAVLIDLRIRTGLPA